jgi:hypothetical protein
VSSLLDNVDPGALQMRTGSKRATSRRSAALTCANGEASANCTPRQTATANVQACCVADLVNAQAC